MHARTQSLALLLSVAACSFGQTACGLDWDSPAPRDGGATDDGPDGSDRNATTRGELDASVDPLTAAPEGGLADAMAPALDGEAGQAATALEDAAVDASVVPEASTTVSSLTVDRALLLHLDETQFALTPGEIRDQSGLSNHGTVKGSGLTAGAGRFGTSLAMSGTGWVEVADAPSLHASSGMTVSAWFWLDVLPGTRWPGIVAKRTAFQVDTAFALFLSPDNHVMVDVDGEESRFASKATVTTGRWYHVAMTFDGSLPAAERVKLYLDGVLDTTAPEPSASIPPHPSSLAVGLLVNGGDTMIGRIDEVGMWTRALSSAEIGELSRAAVP